MSCICTVTSINRVHDHHCKHLQLNIYEHNFLHFDNTGGFSEQFTGQVCWYTDMNYTPIKFPSHELSGYVIKILIFGREVRF